MSGSTKPVVIISSAAVTCLLLIGALSQAAHSSEDGMQLSRNSACIAVNPRAAMSQDGQYLVALWIEGDANDGNCKDRGAAVLRWAAWNNTTYSWSQPVVVGEGATDRRCVAFADVDIQNGAAHIALALQNPCVPDTGERADVFIRYLNYPLAGNNPGSPSDPDDPAPLVYDFQTQNSYPSSIQIAASDDPNKPYVVYGTEQGEVFYVRRNETPLGSPNQLTQGVIPEGDTQDRPSFKPQIAYAEGRVHFLWEARLPTGNGERKNGYPVYRYCTDGLGTCSTAVNLETEGEHLGTYPSPFLDAYNTRLIAGWQRCAAPSYPCPKFQILYTRVEDNGDTFIDRTHPYAVQVGSDQPRDNSGYASTDEPSRIYRARLQPSLTLDNSGLPYVAWQVADGSNQQHFITTTLATDETPSNFSWARLPGLEHRDTSHDHVKPAILVPPSDRDPGQDPDFQGLHLFYMRGDTDESPAYDIYYSYLQEIDPNATPEVSPSADISPSPSPTTTPTAWVPSEDDTFVYLPLIMRGAR